MSEESCRATFEQDGETFLCGQLWDNGFKKYCPTCRDKHLKEVISQIKKLHPTPEEEQNNIIKELKELLNL